jgi:hypothetical protein
MFRRMDGESLLGLTLVVFGIVIIIAIAWVLDCLQRARRWIPILCLVLLSGCATTSDDGGSLKDFAMFMLVGAGGAPAYTPAPQRCVGEWNGSRYIERCD